MNRGRGLILCGGLLLIIGLACSFGSTYYQTRAMGEARKGVIVFGPEKGSPGMREKERHVTRSDWFFGVGLLLTGVGIVLQTWGAVRSLVAAPAPAPVQVAPGQAPASLKPEEIENVRVGYKAAIDLWNTSGTQNWSRFNAMLVANSVILAVIGNVTVDDLMGWQVRVALTGVGLVLCVCWRGAVDRGLTYQDHYVAGALELERHLAPVSSVQDGSHLQMAGFSRMRTRRAMRTVILLFTLLYLSAGGWILWKHICA